MACHSLSLMLKALCRHVGLGAQQQVDGRPHHRQHAQHRQPLVPAAPVARLGVVGHPEGRERRQAQEVERGHVHQAALLQQLAVRRPRLAARGARLVKHGQRARQQQRGHHGRLRALHEQPVPPLQLLLWQRQLLALDGLPQREVGQQRKHAKRERRAHKRPRGHLVLTAARRDKE
eukprot:CAMPEP_0202861844 /NCGR_PEP_ID=MMETSP1391-20130828/3097_1 /ASSEMBLY_ACC=CAM_ASM_000867 /TAXON_ID=1034604 /ORGANISM="Chlamydomonas leiostraca, Strain SAG 11-49" /LENGTH=175 /DNA_ID=CAMNT_0049541281 /DNA_START=1772 /DNA_END=2299 /DNA_ORIENTATION=-